jgi:microcystin-dependent protein
VTTAVSQIPPGTMMLWGGGGGQYVAPVGTAGSVAVPGWLYCNGSAVSQTAYPALYAAIGGRYNTGGETAGTFRLPGVAGYLTYYTTTTSNAEHVAVSTHSHALTGTSTVNALSNESAHTHAGSASTDSVGDHAHGVNIGTSANDTGNVLRASGAVNTHIQGHNHGVGGGMSGCGGVAHNYGSNTAATNAHTHNAPAISSSVTAGATQQAPPSVAIWHIIKI